jgi:antitoxin component of MazEF toxin-antitoxin module
MTESVETVVNNSDHVDIPEKMREMLHIQAGDRIRWTFQGDKLIAEVIKKKKGTLLPLIGKFHGEPTDSVKTHNLMGMH